MKTTYKKEIKKVRIRKAIQAIKDIFVEPIKRNIDRNPMLMVETTDGSRIMVKPKDYGFERNEYQIKKAKADALMVRQKRDATYYNQRFSHDGSSKFGRRQIMWDYQHWVYINILLDLRVYHFGNWWDRMMMDLYHPQFSSFISGVADALAQDELMFVDPKEKNAEEPESKTRLANFWRKNGLQAMYRLAVKKIRLDGYCIYYPVDRNKYPDYWTRGPWFVFSDEEAEAVEWDMWGHPIRWIISMQNRLGEAPALDDFEITIDQCVYFDPNHSQDFIPIPCGSQIWDDCIDYVYIKESMKSFDQRLGNGFMILGVPTETYMDETALNKIKAAIRNIKTDNGIIIPTGDKETSNGIEVNYQGMSGTQVDFVAHLTKYEEGIAWGMRFPVRWLRGDSEGAMESSGKDKLQANIRLNQIHRQYIDFPKAVLKFHNMISHFSQIEVLPGFKLELTEQERAELDSVKTSTLVESLAFETVNEVRAKKKLPPKEGGDELFAQENNDSDNQKDVDTHKITAQGMSSTEVKADAKAKFTVEQSEAFKQRLKGQVQLQSSVIEEASFTDFLKDVWNQRFKREIERGRTEQESAELADHDLFSTQSGAFELKGHRKFPGELGEKIRAKSNKILDRDIKAREERLKLEKTQKDKKKGGKGNIFKAFFAEGKQKGMSDDEAGDHARNKIAGHKGGKKESVERLNDVFTQISIRNLATALGFSTNTIKRGRANLRDPTVHEINCKFDSVQIEGDIWEFEGPMITPITKEDYANGDFEKYPDFDGIDIRSASEIKKWWKSKSPKEIHLGVTPTSDHSSKVPLEVLQNRSIGITRATELLEEPRTMMVDNKEVIIPAGSIWGKRTIDLKKVDKILGADNWVRQKHKNGQNLTSSIALWSHDIYEGDTRKNTNLDVRSEILTHSPRNKKTFAK